MSKAEPRERVLGQFRLLQSWPARYGFAVLMIAIATAFQFALGLLGPFHLAFILFYPAVVVAAQAGLGPGIMATLLAAFSGDYFFFEPKPSLAIQTPEELVGPILFCIIGIFLTLLTCSRREATEALKKSEGELNRAQTVAHIGSWYYDFQQNVLRFSKEACQILALTQSTLSPEQALEMVHGEDRQRLDRGWKAALESGVCDEEIRVVVGARTRWVRLQANGERDGQGRPAKAVGALQDITDSKLAEQRLQEFERLVEGLEEMITVVDRDYRYLIANRAFLNYRGMKKEDLIGRLAQEILDPKVFPVVKEKLEECFEGKVVQYELQYEYPLRGWRELFISYFPLEGPSGVDRVASILLDVTDQKRAERSLKLFRTLIEHSNDTVEVIDPDTLRFLDINDKACQELGYTREELLAMTVFDIDPQADEERQARVLAEMRDRGFALLPTAHRRKDGSVFPVEVNLKLVNLERSYIVAVSRDISERKKAEDALRESEDRYRDLVEHSEDLVCVHDLDGNLLSANPASARILGYAVEELLRIPMRELIIPEGRPAFDEYLKRLRTTGQPEQGLLCVMTRSGEVRIWEYRNTLRTEGVSMPVVRGIAHDITDKRRAELALGSSKQRYRMLFEKNIAGVMVSTLDGTVLECNDSCARMLGYDSPKELCGRRTPELYVDAGDRQSLIDELESTGASLGRELQVKLKDGRKIWIVLNCSLWRSEEGEALIQATAIDITERKLAEEALRESEQSEKARARELETILDTLPIPVLISRDRECREISSNRAGWEHLGLRPGANASLSAQVERPQIRVLQEGRELSPDELPMQRAAATGHAVQGVATKIVLDNGTVKYELGNAAPLFDEHGNVRGAIGAAIDITDRIQAEEALRESEQRMRLAQEIARIGAFERNLVTGVSRWSPEMEAIYGLQPGCAPKSVEDFIELVHPDDRSKISELVQTSKELGYAQGEWRVIWPDGTVHWITGCWRVFYDSEGKPFRAIGMDYDITERRRAEEALQQSEQHFRLLVEQASDGIFVSDAQGNYTDVNSAGAEMLGYTREEILQLSIPDVIAKEQVARVVPETTALTENGIVRSEWTFRRKDGSFFPGEISAKRLPDGRLQAILRDVTERRCAEETIRRSEERFRVALKESPITVFNQNKDLVYTWVYNSQLRGSDEILGKNDAEIFGEDVGSRMHAIKRRVMEKGVGEREEMTFTFNGQKRMLELTIEALQDAEGTIIGITGAAIDIARLRKMLDRLQIAREKLIQEKSYLESEIQSELGFEEIIGQSTSLREVLKQTRVVAATDSTVLLLGETGTGKELVARSIHSLSARKDRNFIKLNCAAVPSGLLESELFGHEKGAFTGAVTQKAGRVELADKGTLFLDEIGELPGELQPKLLRMLQDREFERLGGVRTMKVDVRIISATNRDLQSDVAEKKFREDLFYRLNVFPIRLPALRERRSDIPMLVRHFVSKHAQRMGKHIELIPDATMQLLQKWSWPGNIRELENMLERMVILTNGEILAEAPVELNVETELVQDSLTEMEREHILRILRETNGVLSGEDGAANRLGIKRTTLQSMLKRFGIEPRDYKRGAGTSRTQ